MLALKNLGNHCLEKLNKSIKLVAWKLNYSKIKMIIRQIEFGNNGRVSCLVGNWQIAISNSKLFFSYNFHS